MPHAHQEIERSFSPGPGDELPDLTALGAVVAVEPAGEDELDATYYDAPGLPLLRAGVTLRRRAGGDDEGWHLKLPGATSSTRTELQEGLGAGGGRPPAELGDLVAGWTRGIALAPVARIRTKRRTSRLVGADGGVLAEVAEDEVEGLPAQLGGERRRWREWEVELRAGGGALLDEAEALLAAQGVPRSDSQRKLSLVLDAGPEVQPPRERKRLTRKAPAADVLDRWLVDQCREIEWSDPVVRQGEPGGVHRMRKACRRLRAALATCRPLLDRTQTDPLRDELRWLAGSLGPARDDEVVLERIVALLDMEAEASDVEAARQLLDRFSSTRAEHEAADLATLLASPRYFALRAALDALVADPPWSRGAARPAAKVLPRLVRKEQKRARRRRHAENPHDLRKAVKRLRYAYELVEPVWGKAAARPRTSARELTRLLGDRQDALVAREWLAALSSADPSISPDAPDAQASFVFGRLHAQEEQHEGEVLARVGPAWRALRSRSW
jgi:CHAD domain-containing protein